MALIGRPKGHCNKNAMAGKQRPQLVSTIHHQAGRKALPGGAYGTQHQVPHATAVLAASPAVLAASPPLTGVVAHADGGGCVDGQPRAPAEAAHLLGQRLHLACGPHGWVGQGWLSKVRECQAGCRIGKLGCPLGVTRPTVPTLIPPHQLWLHRATPQAARPKCVLPLPAPAPPTHPRCRPPAAPPWPQTSGCRPGRRTSQSRPPGREEKGSGGGLLCWSMQRRHAAWGCRERGPPHRPPPHAQAQQAPQGPRPAAQLAGQRASSAQHCAPA